MRRLAGFLVEKHILVLVVFLVLAAGSVFLLPKVKINYDMTKYLPRTSSMKQGMDLMEKEFGNTDAAKLEIMFEGLADDEKLAIRDELEEMEYVESVSYKKDSTDYNKDDYTLYILNTELDEYSSEGKQLFERLKAAYDADHATWYGGAIAEANTTQLPMYIVVLALAMLFGILFIMCRSWAEPFLFLFCIIIAILLNIGTNAFFPYVSDTTNSMAAILQLVLSMDYSIILMNRYRQEKALTRDKKEAMKQTLTRSFAAICGSSITTFVGLLALCFMSFKIGTDLGLVLAKGVLFSLICILTVLPALVLIFDKLIDKLQKKNLPLNLTKLGNAQYKMRFVMPVILIGLFVFLFFGKNHTEISYALDTNNYVDKVFKPDNTLIVLYDNRDSGAVESIADQIESDGAVKSVMSYESLLAREYTAGDLTDTMDEQGMDTDLDDTMIRLVYYNYHAGKEKIRLSLPQLVTFLKDEVLEDETFGADAGNDIREHLADMEKFTDKDRLTKKMSAKELSVFFGPDKFSESQVKDLMVYYYSKHGGVSPGRMTIPVFIDFLLDDVANDRTYGDKVSSDAKRKLRELKKYTVKKNVTTRMNAADMAGFLSMDKAQVELLYMYYRTTLDTYHPPKMTLKEFIRFLTEDVAKHKQFSSYVDKKTLRQLNQMKLFVDKKEVQKKRPSSELASLLSMDETMVQMVMLSASGALSQTPPETDAETYQKMMEETSQQMPQEIDYGALTAGMTMSLEDMVDALIKMSADPAYAAQFDKETKARLGRLKTMMAAGVNGTKYSDQKLAQMFDLKGSDMRVLFSLHDYYKNGIARRVSVQKLIHYLISNENTFGAQIGKKKMTQLNTLKKIMDGALAGDSCSPAKMAELFSMKEKDLKALYLLRIRKYGDTSAWRISPHGFINFLVDDVLSNEKYADEIDSASRSDLKTARRMVNGVVLDTTYTAEEAAKLFGSYADDLEEEDLSLLYLYYGSLHKYDSAWTMSILKLVDYIDQEILTDPRFEEHIDSDARVSIKDMRDGIDEAVKKLKSTHYGRMIINSSLADDSNETRAFITGLHQTFDEKTKQDYYIIGSSAMNYEMSNTFRDEYNRITLITAALIFLVVLFTFRNAVIPVILVFLIQTGVYATMTFMGAAGFEMFYTALLIVQSILMGATIDYAILYTTYYREMRSHSSIKEALGFAYNGSIHTILTSAMIMAVITGILSKVFTNPAVGQICITISIGCICATMLILFVLPGVLAASDRLLVKKKQEDSQTGRN